MYILSIRGPKIIFKNDFAIKIDLFQRWDKNLKGKEKRIGIKQFKFKSIKNELTHERHIVGNPHDIRALSVA